MLYIYKYIYIKHIYQIRWDFRGPEINSPSGFPGPWLSVAAEAGVRQYDDDPNLDLPDEEQVAFRPVGNGGETEKHREKR